MPYPKLPAVCAPQVHTCGDRRRLEFQPGMIQSEMLLSRPDHLLLRYARAMMCFTLFVPRPRHILMVGLGGGSLLKFCHRHLPEARITVLELRADVIALREQFMLPPDDARLRIIETVPIAMLLLVIGALVWQADAVLRYANATARSLHDPREYIGSVVSTKPLPSPHTTGEGGLRR